MQQKCQTTIINMFVACGAHLAAPFCSITLPLCRCPCSGKPRSLRNSSASSICRPRRCTWLTGSPFGLRVYLRAQGSFHWACKRSSLSIKINKKSSCLAHLKDEILETAARVEGRHEAGIVMRAVAQEAQIEHGIYIRMMQ